MALGLLMDVWNNVAFRACVLGAALGALLGGPTLAWQVHQQQQKLAALEEIRLGQQIAAAELEYAGVVRKAWAEVSCDVDHKAVVHIEPFCDRYHKSHDYLALWEEDEPLWDL